MKHVLYGIIILFIVGICAVWSNRPKLWKSGVGHDSRKATVPLSGPTKADKALASPEAKMSGHTPPIPKPVRKPFVAKRDKRLNKEVWAGDGFNMVLKNECGKCLKACHYDKKDPGGFTCTGIAVRYNADMYARVLNRYFQLCKDFGVFVPPGSTDAFGMRKDLCYELRSLYWLKYFKKFKSCDYTALSHLGDTAVLQGPVVAVRILQEMAGLKIDGIFGKKSLNACQRDVFNPKKYISLRLKHLKSRSVWGIYGKGWEKRLMRMLKKYHYD